MDWKTLADATLAQKTILILGPEISINFNNAKRTNQALSDIKNNCPAGLYVSFNEKDEFMITSDRRAKIHVQNKIKEFYSEDFSNSALEKLAEIPFHLIISITPDSTMEQIFKKKNFALDSNYYSGKNLRPVDKSPTAEQPLVYHLFGSVDDTESMLIAYSDLYKYLKSVFAYEYLPDVVKRQFKGQAEHIIFLGLDFEKWYYQLILNMLGLDEDPCMQYALSASQFEGRVKNLYEEYFKITFVANEMQSFVEQFHASFKPENLRKPQENAATSKKYLVNNVMKFLNATYNATDLDSLRMCNFEEVEFVPEQSKTSRINMLLDFIKRQERFDELLKIGKDDNPVQFEKFQPYFE